MSCFRSRTRLLGYAFASILACCAGAAAAATHPVLFRHVNIVPMDQERVLRDCSVLVRDGLIVAIGSGLPAPAGGLVIDGHGRDYLSPGLADMHVHSSTARDMKLYLAKGVTTVLNMGGERNGFMDQIVPKLNRGEIPGPHFYSSFIVDGTPEYGNFVVQTPAQARAVVDLAKTNGYDFIKVYNNLAPNTFREFVAAGREMGVPVIGHGVTRVGLQRQLAEGQILVAHTEEYLYTVFFPGGVDVGTRAPSVDQISAAVAFTKNSGAYVTADVDNYATIARQWGKPAALRRLLQAPGMRYVDTYDWLAWKQAGYTERKGAIDRRLIFLERFTKALSDASVPLITGTDAPAVPGQAPGYSLHSALRRLHRIGLSPYRALAAATRVPGEFIAQTKPGGPVFGVVAVGARADLLLSEGNPLEKMATLEHPIGVMSHGHWYPRAELAAMLQELASGYERPISSRR